MQSDDGSRSNEMEKATAFIIVEIIEYVPGSVVIKTILKKRTGNVSAVSVDSDGELEEKASPFDIFIQIIEGRTEIFIEDDVLHLETGQSVIIPAHSRNSFKAGHRFKMISTVIKSGYEEVS
ncbi:cupin domain-containing protein [Natronogracilivirga saccharolytica]|uniref:Cupin domain-containing protein n=1 Tax=Natronogracilivirga saccharolytica TaxID=2812953 RepID=A0A8J7S7Y2_9BACT|nr:cupin domain-containing protein [Natronogracilivirga saccharolytica]MBP3191888.1 cupin domain-containing protein [Natronogracilivirga saccharolytica]